MCYLVNRVALPCSRICEQLILLWCNLLEDRRLWRFWDTFLWLLCLYYTFLRELIRPLYWRNLVWIPVWHKILTSKASYPSLARQMLNDTVTCSLIVINVKCLSVQLHWVWSARGLLYSAGLFAPISFLLFCSGRYGMCGVCAGRGGQLRLFDSFLLSQIHHVLNLHCRLLHVH